MTSKTLPQTRPIHRDDLNQLCTADESQLRQTMARRSPSSKPLVALIPDIDTMVWHHAREEFVANELSGRKPEIKGAMIGHEMGRRAWCIWTRMYYNEDPNASTGNHLHILRLVVEEDNAASRADSEKPIEGTLSTFHTQAVAGLMVAAQEEAGQWNMEDVWLWNPNATAVAAAKMVAKDVQVVDRDSDSIASLRWFGKSDRAAKEGDATGGPADVEWLCIEKYGWC